ncbi:MAG: protein phosphatase CheZ [Gammaproteobacteria bacterium]|nr:hypothetical protein [Gammaproteobacteria bacterium]
MDRDERLSWARRLVRAIEAGDSQAENEAANAIARRQTLHLHEQLQRIAKELRETLCNLDAAEELARIAHRELPDTHVRLNQVISLTEEAAHSTLSAVEASMPLADGIAEAVERYRAEHALPRGPRGKALAALFDSVTASATELRARLSDVMMAQSFQDITGQIIRRVAGLVADLEAVIAKTHAARHGSAEHRRSSNAGEGPALPGRHPDVVAGQADVDELLSELGV